MEFLTIYSFVLLLKMKPWGSFQVNKATNVVFMILGGCFISEIVLNLSFRWVKKILVKSDSMFTLACEQVLHVRVSQSIHWTINFHWLKNLVRERWFFTEWNFIVLDADWLLLIRNDYYAQPYRWINLYTHIINRDYFMVGEHVRFLFTSELLHVWWNMNPTLRRQPGKKLRSSITKTRFFGHFRRFKCCECRSTGLFWK